MDVLKQQLLGAWRMHESKTMALLEHVTQAGLECTLSTRSGRTVGQQLVHIQSVRWTMLERMRKDLLEGLPKLDRAEGHDRDRLVEGLRATARALETLIREAEDGAVKVFKGGLAMFVCYLVAHESHHRGGIMLTLKQCKQSLGKDAWALWGWSGAPPETLP